MLLPATCRFGLCSVDFPRLVDTAVVSFRKGVKIKEADRAALVDFPIPSVQKKPFKNFVSTDQLLIS